ncbi:hypothetical protein OAM69_07385, partial [bacterium]|nr:hypothetical protein [bacterium]
PTGIVDSVAVDETSGTYSLGSPPDPIGNLTLNPVGGESQPITIVSGGSLEIQVSADTGYSTIFVTTDDGGYFTVQLSEAVTVSALILNFSPSQQEGNEVQIGVQVNNSEGEVSARQDVKLIPVFVGTGDLQVSMSWDIPTDVDLHLFEPDGTEIYWDEGISSSGGRLVLDSNANCLIDGVNNESITYDGVVPPSGEYTVGIEYFNNCGLKTPTRYLVTTRVDDMVKTFGGTLVPLDDNDETIEITRFNFR